MADILLVGDRLFPPLSSEDGKIVFALARAFSDQHHRVCVLTLFPENQADNETNLARRLRTVNAKLADGERTCPLFEGTSAIGQFSYFVLGVTPEDRGHAAAFLASATSALVQDKLFNPNTVIAWGETSTPALSTTLATTRLFVLPTGSWTGPLSGKERAALNPHAADLELAQYSLAGLGAINANTVVFPTLSAQTRFFNSPDFSYRASDLQLVTIRLGCDEAPFDPAVDTTIPSSFSTSSTTGKIECRKQFARRSSLALGPRTLLLATSCLYFTPSARAFISSLPIILSLDVVLAIPEGGDSVLEEQAKRFAIEFPGKVAIIPRSKIDQDRCFLASADAMLLFDENSQSGRETGLCHRYGTLPVAPKLGAYDDYITDFDPISKTGNGILFSPSTPQEVVIAIDRVRGLKEDIDTWNALQQQLLCSYPRWEATVEMFKQLEAKEPTVG